MHPFIRHLLAGALLLATPAASPGRLSAADSSLRSVPQTLLFTAGTTHRDPAGHDHAFVLWQAPAADLMSGRAFALYGKAGTAEAAGTFALEGVVQSSLDEKLTAVQLARAEAIGENLSALDETLSALWRQAHLPTPDALAALQQAGQPLPDPPALPSARPLRTVTVLQKLFTAPDILAGARTAAMSQPALALVLGCAWVGPMPTGATRTWELREWDPQTCVDGAVIGRVTLTGGAPVVLPAPGTPVQVPDRSELGDLRIGLRWATPDALKRRLFLHQGYQVWRMPWATALAQNFHVTPPTSVQLATFGTRVNTSPLYIDRLFTDVTVADFLADATSRHFTDDNGRFADPAVPAPFPDGAEFGYVITARDILGRDGQPSRAGRGQACRTLAPPVPRGLQAHVEYGAALADGTRPQSFAVSWTANTDPPAPLPADTTRYELFRTDDRFVDGTGAPDPARRIALVPHLPGQITASHTSPAGPPGTTWQFAIRAVLETACGPLYSALSPPVSVATEDNAAPNAPEATGPPPGDCPNVAIAAHPTLTPGVVPGESAPRPSVHVRLLCERRDPGVGRVTFTQTTLPPDEPASTVELGSIEFGADDSESVSLDTELSLGVARTSTVVFTFQATSFDGRNSRKYSFARAPIANTQPSTQINRWATLCGLVAPSSIRLQDPLGVTFTAPEADIPFASVSLEAGTARVAGIPASNPGNPCLVSRRLPDGSWKEIGLGRILGGTVYFEDLTPAAPEPPETEPEPEPAPSSSAADYRAHRLVNMAACGDGAHLAVDGDGRPVPVNLMLLSHPDAREYRFYRRVDDGELELIAQGPQPKTLGIIQRQDSGVPPAAETVSYYGQFMGKNGVASPLRLLGTIRPVFVPPTPVLSPPEAIGDAAAPKIRLKWACPPDRLRRFELFLDTAKSSRKYSVDQPAALSTLTAVNYEPPPSAPPRQWRIRRAGQAAQTTVRREGLLTPPVGSTPPGTGPTFTIDLPVRANQRYSISLRAVGQHGAGQTSRTFDFLWRPPPAATPDKPLPWPFRELPTLVDESTANAAGLRPENLPDASGEPALRWPDAATGPHVGFRLGTMNSHSGEVSARDARLTEVKDGQDRLTGLRFYPDLELPTRDFAAYVARVPGSVRPVLPAALYRQQLANDEWPVVSGDVVQVSPLVSRIAWENEDGPAYGILRDPYIALTTDIEVGSAYFREANLYLLDTTPHVAGARYRYFLVCFGADSGAPELVIPGTLEPRPAE